MEAILNKLQELCAMVSQKNAELDIAIKEADLAREKYETLSAENKAEKKVLKAERAEIKGVKDIVALKKSADEALALSGKELDDVKKVAIEEEKKVKNARLLMVSERATLDNRKECLDGKEADLKIAEAKLAENTKKVKIAAKKLGIKL